MAIIGGPKEAIQRIVELLREVALPPSQMLLDEYDTAFGLGYAITSEPSAGLTPIDHELFGAMHSAREFGAIYTISPELRPAPDPYVWIDPWEGRE